MTLVQPTPEQQLRIRSELNENVSTRDQDLEHIKDWLKRQPHLPQFDGMLSNYSYLIFIFTNKNESVDDIFVTFHFYTCH